MKKLNLFLLTVLSVVLLSPIALIAQGDPPPQPGCCPRGPEAAGQDQTGSLVARGRILISTGMLQAQGITKREFVERLSVSIFAGKQVDLVLTVRSSADRLRPGSLSSVYDAPVQGLMAVHETRVYRVPLYSLEAEQFEALEQFGLTDGVVQLTVRFIKSSSLESDTY